MGKRSKRKAAKRKLEKKSFNTIHPLRKPSKSPIYRDNYGNLISPIEIAFPIIKKVSDNKFIAVGTGFFIHPAGGFVTAKHCLFNEEVYDSSCYAIHSVEKGNHILRKIQYFEPHPFADIGVGMLRGKVINYQSNALILKATFPISKTPPTVNSEIITHAYPRMRIKQNQYGIFPCDKYAGTIIEILTTQTGKLNSEIYVTNMEIGKGASGGPVLHNNRIIGVNSTGFNNAKHEEPLNFITPISYIYDLTIQDSDGKKTTIQELMDKGFIVKPQ